MARPAATALGPSVWRIPTVRPYWVNSFAIVDDDGSVTLVDTGLRRAPARIVAGLAAIGKHPADVTRIVLTHGHIDHASGAAELARETGASVVMHDRDAAHVLAGRPPPPGGSSALGRLMRRLPGGRFPPVNVGERLTGDAVLDIGGGLRVVPTPGHSPGHVSLLHEPSRVLITGDALFNWRNMRWPPRSLCTDFRLTQQTAQVFADLDFDVVAFTHGQEITERARERVRRFVSDAP